jgi:hypothetical protein
MFSAYIPATLDKTLDFVLAADESNFKERENWFPEFPNFKLIRSSSYLDSDIIHLGVLKHKETEAIKLVQSYDNGYNDITAIELVIPKMFANFDIVQLSAGHAVPPRRKKDNYAYFQNPETKEKFLFDWNRKECGVKANKLITKETDKKEPSFDAASAPRVGKL